MDSHRHGPHSVYSIHLHPVWVTKYRKPALAGAVGVRVRDLIREVCGTHDAKRYRGAVSFFNMQLAPLAGLGSVDALDRVRSKAIDAGWLHYTPGAKGVAGRYWVLIPDQFQGMDDAPSDENARDYVPGNLRESAEASPREAEGKCGSNRGECAEPSSLALSLNTSTPAEAGKHVVEPGSETKPNALRKTDRPTADADPRFAQFWAAYPLKPHGASFRAEEFVFAQGSNNARPRWPAPEQADRGRYAPHRPGRVTGVGSSRTR